MDIKRHVKHKGLTEDGIFEIMEKADDDVVVEKGIDTTIEGKILAMTQGRIIPNNLKGVFDLTPDSTPQEVEDCIEGCMSELPLDRVEAAYKMASYQQSIKANKEEIKKLTAQKEHFENIIKEKKLQLETKTTSDSSTTTETTTE